MKKLLLFGALSALSFGSVASAQPATRSRIFSAREVGGQTWPRFARVNHGDYDARVAALQLLLRNRGFYKGEINGYFDSMSSRPTERAVKAFQRASGLKVDGIVGPKTWGKLLIRIKRGDKGDAVRALQTIIRDGGYNDPYHNNTNAPYTDLKIDGVFGAATEEAVRNYQKDSPYLGRHVQIKVDGVVGPQTWALFLAPVAAG